MTKNENYERLLLVLMQYLQRVRLPISLGTKWPVWKYITGRRLAIFVEESMFCGTKWGVFEPNDEPLHAQIEVQMRKHLLDQTRRTRSPLNMR
ncbi:hypothetical protein AMJ83_11180 [candidate division WOR_3 bacterium SM23_42]|uniref:Uncharacterized protein n=1 Tax=candidate division WOR_3 bacterium SM23_42 TaxID=1703779 RepID=A0A0S8FNT6_UNCW3|nr:MAG: hypothetical protein AMJ83_11180 [candidate division WOR_3 bacterium SM23_42]